MESIPKSFPESKRIFHASRRKRWYFLPCVLVAIKHSIDGGSNNSICRLIDLLSIQQIFLENVYSTTGCQNEMTAVYEGGKCEEVGMVVIDN